MHSPGLCLRILSSQVGLKYEQFQSTAPALQATITAKSKNGSEVKEVLQVELTKQKMSTGSYGWSSAGKRINLEIELEDGTKETIQAQVSCFAVSRSTSIADSYPVVFEYNHSGLKGSRREQQ